ncbi:MAG: AAA family ATPase, partial [Actinomycetota bacterium]|nr:AAA family ATPase [Actinomycetota bacterium]
MHANGTEERLARGAEPGARTDDAGATRIELCGSLRVLIRGRPVTDALPGRQGRALFAFLAVNRHRPVNRQELLDVLWPEDLPEAPEAGLSTILARARRAVGPGVIEGRSELRLELPPDADVDLERVAAGAEEAERALAAGEPEGAILAAETALEIAARPLLPGTEGAWVQACRDELAALEPDLLEALASAALAAGGREHLATAERTARTLAERHPFRESGYALLIEVHARRGNVAEATLTYDRMRVLLRDELGTTPSAALSAMHEDLVVHGRIPGAPAQEAGGRASADDTSPAAGVPLPVIGGARASTSFVGRDDHLRRLRAPWLEAGTGQRRLALLVGDPGVGKTRLAAQFAAEVHESGATVLYGRCDEEPLLSYQPFIEALRHYLRHGDWRADADAERDLQELARLIPEARSDDATPPPSQDPETERYRLFEAVARLIGRATRSRPLLFVLDDLHWADKPTLLLLRQLLRHDDPARLMVLGIFRDVDVGADHPLAE